MTDDEIRDLWPEVLHLRGDEIDAFHLWWNDTMTSIIKGDQ